MRHLNLIVGLVLLSLLGATTQQSNNQVNNSVKLLQSPKAEEREQGKREVIEEFARAVESLVDILESPRGGADDGWLDMRTPRNLAIECAGELRAVRTVGSLLPLLEPYAGEKWVRDTNFHIAPAGQALIKIGQPCIPAVVRFLAAIERQISPVPPHGSGEDQKKDRNRC